MPGQLHVDLFRITLHLMYVYDNVSLVTASHHQFVISERYLVRSAIEITFPTVCPSVVTRLS